MSKRKPNNSRARLANASGHALTEEQAARIFDAVEAWPSNEAAA